MILGGPALFLAGQAAFKATVWRRISWPRIGAIAVLALLGLLAPHVAALVLSAAAAAVVIAVAIADQLCCHRPTGHQPTRNRPDQPSVSAGPRVVS